MKWTVLIVASFLHISCGNKTNEVIDTYDRNKLVAINYEEILGNKSQIFLSDIASHVEYIRFETNQNCLFTMKPVFHFTDQYIFVNNKKHVLQFDRKGNFIKQIGKHGRGPGEIGLIRRLTVLDDEELIIVQTNWARKLYYFNFEGELLKQRKVQDAHKIIGFPDDRLMYFDYCADGDEDYMFTLINNMGDTTGVVNNHYKWENRTGFAPSMSYNLFRPFYNYRGETYFKSRHNDTIYKTNGSMIKPAYFIDLGRFLLPQENRVEALNSSISNRMQDFREVSSGYRFVSTLEAGEKIFISSSDYENFWEDMDQYNILYQRSEANGSLVVDKSGSPSGLINDLDGGPEFWPIGSVNDSTVYRILKPFEIVDMEIPNSTIEKNGPVAENTTGIKKLIDEIKEDDNAVLMLIHLK